MPAKPGLLWQGKMWITKEMAESKDKRVMGHGDKRQFTLLSTTAVLLCGV